jgi:hypothetical protein
MVSYPQGFFLRAPLEWWQLAVPLATLRPHYLGEDACQSVTGAFSVFAPRRTRIKPRATSVALTGEFYAMESSTRGFFLNP